MPTTHDEYEIISTIGSGSYGTCKKICRKKDGKILVWKELDYGSMSDTEKQMLVSEVNLLRELRHRYIVRYYDRIIDRSTTTLYIIMEYCEGGDLASYITQLKKEKRSADESFVWRICQQIVQALRECHSRSKNGKVVLHRDLKPANVFLDTDKNVKLGDFGLARVLQHETSFARTFVGTPYYMSPEQMNYMSYNEKSDVWSLGCLLYELCALRPPFTANSQRELASRIRIGHFQRIPSQFSDDLNDLIGYMLQVEEYRRPTMDKLQEQLVSLARADISGGSGDASSGVLESGGRHDERLGLREKQLEKQEEELRHREQLLQDRQRQIHDQEEALRELEQQLKLKQIDLDNQKRIVELRGKAAEEKLERAQRLLEEHRNHLLNNNNIIKRHSTDYRHPSDSKYTHERAALYCDTPTSQESSDTSSKTTSASARTKTLKSETYTLTKTTAGVATDTLEPGEVALLEFSDSGSSTVSSAFSNPNLSTIRHVLPPSDLHTQPAGGATSHSTIRPLLPSSVLTTNHTDGATISRPLVPPSALPTHHTDEATKKKVHFSQVSVGKENHRYGDGAGVVAGDRYQHSKAQAVAPAGSLSSDIQQTLYKVQRALAQRNSKHLLKY